MPTCAFLSEKSTLFCGERVRGAMLRARIFCLWRTAESNVDGRRRTGRRWPQAARARGRGWRSIGGATCEKRVRERKRIVFLFLGGKSESSCSLLGGSRGRSAAVAALGYRHHHKKQYTVAARGGKTQLVEGCGLWPPNPAYPAYRP